MIDQGQSRDIDLFVTVFVTVNVPNFAFIRPFVGKGLINVKRHVQGKIEKSCARKISFKNIGHALV